VSPATLDEIERRAMDEVEEATTMTRNAPPPPADTLMTDVWADGGSAWRN
jgi:pyruvate dehydrogenase E1 component alpha subunit